MWNSRQSCLPLCFAKGNIWSNSSNHDSFRSCSPTGMFRLASLNRILHFPKDFAVKQTIPHTNYLASRIPMHSRPCHKQAIYLVSGSRNCQRGLPVSHVTFRWSWGLWKTLLVCCSWGDKALLQKQLKRGRAWLKPERMLHGENQQYGSHELSWPHIKAF